MRAARAVLVLLLATFAPAAWAKDPDAPKPIHDKPYLWVVEGPTRVFLFGTIHVPEPRVLALPRIVTEAFAASDTVSTEVAMDAASMAAVNEATTALSALPEGQRLASLLSENLRARTQALLPASMNLEALDQRQPWFVYFMLLQLQLLPYMTGEPPLDAAFYRDAQAAGKAVGAIETAEAQLRIFADLEMDEQIQMLDDLVTALSEAEAEGKDLVGEVVDIYLRGDPQALMEAMNEEWDPETPLGKKLRERILDHRNAGMAAYVMKRIEAQPDKTHFVAVGAGHYAGTAGVVALLRARGLTVRRLTVDDPLPEASPAHD